MYLKFFSCRKKQFLGVYTPFVLGRRTLWFFQSHYQWMKDPDSLYPNLKLSLALLVSLLESFWQSFKSNLKFYNITLLDHFKFYLWQFLKCISNTFEHSLSLCSVFWVSNIFSNLRTFLTYFSNGLQQIKGFYTLLRPMDLFSFHRRLAWYFVVVFCVWFH